MDDPSNVELAQRFLQQLNRITFLNANSLVAELSRRTAAEAADYIMANMRSAMSFDDHLQLLGFAIRKVQVEGLIAEFGVHKGETVNHISSLVRHRPVFGFDSFEGLKEDWRGHHNMVAGTFSLDGQLPLVNTNVHLVKGWFHESLPPFLAQHSGVPFAFVHVDSDTYESAKTIFDLVGGRFAVGTVIVFDEYLNYRGWKLGEYKAWHEYCARTRTAYEYLGFCIQGEQVAVRITAVG